MTLAGNWQYGSGVQVDITSGGCSFYMTIASGQVTAGAITCSGSTEVRSTRFA